MGNTVSSIPINQSNVPDLLNQSNASNDYNPFNIPIIEFNSSDDLNACI